MTLPFLDISRPWLRLCYALLCFLLFLCVGMLLLQKSYKTQQEEASLRDAKRILTDVEALLLAAEKSNDQAAGLLASPCANVTIALSKIAALSPVIRSSSLARDGQFYCSSIFGVRSWREKDPDYQAGRLQLFPGNFVTPEHPFLSLRSAFSNGEVVSTIDSETLRYVLSTRRENSNALLNVGYYWLDSQGEFKHNATFSEHFRHETLSSTKFPLSIHILLSPVNRLSDVLSSNKVSVGFLTLFSLLVSAVTWWLLGRPRSPIGEIARAIRAHEFIPFVQPLVDAKSHEICGAEVLMRWKHPSVGIINPDLFIPQAEASGLIAPMTWQLMRSVAEQLEEYCGQFPKHFHLSFNISGACCKKNRLLGECRKFLAHTRDKNIQLVLEITERETLITDGSTIQLIEDISNMGVRLAIDDFGTGHSSLAYLQNFKVDTLKIDQSFVRRIGTEPLSQHIVDNVIDLGLRLGISLVAEGVETLQQADYLRDKGVGSLQGYLFGRPVPMQDFLKAITKQMGLATGK